MKYVIFTACIYMCMQAFTCLQHFCIDFPHILKEVRVLKEEMY